jgi:hypothetical protein
LLIQKLDAEEPLAKNRGHEYSHDQTEISRSPPCVGITDFAGIRTTDILSHGKSGSGRGASDSDRAAERS